MVTGRDSGELAGEDPLLGRSVHAFTATAPVLRASRTVVVIGVLAVLAVPLSLKFLHGAWSTIVAVVAAVAAVACYLLSGARLRPPAIEISLFERGIKVVQGSALRSLLWNQIVEVSARRVPLSPGRESVAVVFEVVGEQPLLIMVGAPFSDEQSTRSLMQALSDAWLSVWSRRAAVMIETGRTLQVGRARVSAGGVEIGQDRIAWGEITGAQGDSGQPRLQTSAGPLDAEQQGANVPFPSSARRLAELAQQAANLPRLVADAALPPSPASQKNGKL